MSTRQVYIDSEIHQAVDIIFNKTLVFSSAELKNYINTGTIQIDYNKTDNKKFLPFYDCLYYPTVSIVKCADNFDNNDWQKLEQEIEKAFPNQVQTYHFYKVRRLTNELAYFLKIMLHGHFSPMEFDAIFGVEHFIKQYKFISDNNADINSKNEYKEFWCKILSGLLTEQSVRIRRFVDTEYRPIGQYAVETINYLKGQIGCA